MDTTQLIRERDRWAIRMVPLVVLAMVMLIMMTVPAQFVARTRAHFLLMAFGPVLATLGSVAWWFTGARAGSPHRWLIPVLLVVPSIPLSMPTLLKSQPPFDVVVFGLPFVLSAVALVLVASVVLKRRVRQAMVYGAIIVAWGLFSLVRIDGTSADLAPEFSWVWSASAESEASALNQRQLSDKTIEFEQLTEGDWPRFRGPQMDSTVPTIEFNIDWEAEPPKQLWRQPIGPGWGSVSVVGQHLFTQEQRGEEETTVCYDLNTGQEVWRHAEKTLFRETIAGAGPRSTPTYVDGKLYVMGATGRLQCLDASTGAAYWVTDLTEATGASVPQWGYASSPLVHNGKVLVYAGGSEGKGLAAFDSTTGKLLWGSGNASHSYSSAQLATLDGVEQYLLTSNIGIEGFDITTGQVLWRWDWLQTEGNRVTQPMIVSDTDLLLGTGVGSELGTRRLNVQRTGSTWAVSEVWFTNKLKPYFNDGVLHDGYYYGFDDKSLTCVDVASGAVKWSAGTIYGHGQVVLLPAMDILLVQAVDGKVALVQARPDDYEEITKFQAINRKTWNHPVIAHGKLICRNGTEIAVYDLNIKK